MEETKWTFIITEEQLGQFSCKKYLICELLRINKAKSLQPCLLTALWGCDLS